MATTPYPFVSGAVLLASELNSTFNIPTSTKTDSYTLVAADAGKRIIMNKATPTTITVNTSLFSASDVVEILNIGAGTCTITAGTATVSTSGSLALVQYGGGRLVFTSASASIFETGSVDYPFQSYTPTWTSSGTAPSLGNGTIVGKYQQIGKLVTFRAVLTLGSTSTIGTGQYSLSLPVNAINQDIATINGSGFAVDASAGASGYYFVRPDVVDSVSSVRLRLYNSSATYATLSSVAQDTPFTFTTSDSINISGTYEAA